MARDAGADDRHDALREWRWRSYLDHLEDLGYDLEHGGVPEGEPGPATAGHGRREAARTGSARSLGLS